MSNKIFSGNFFWLKIKKILKIGAKKKMLGRPYAPKLPSSCRALLSTGAPPYGPRCFWIKSLEPTGYRVPLVIVFKSGSQRVKDTVVKSRNSIRIQSTKSTISKKKSQESEIWLNVCQTVCKRNSLARLVHFFTVLMKPKH